MYSTQLSKKKFLTKAEFCNFCGISESTGYKLMKNRKVKFIKCREGLLHFYKIPIEEAYRYPKTVSQNADFKIFFCDMEKRSRNKGFQSLFSK